MAAAFMGPTVWDDDGPMPILKRSKTLNAIFCFLDILLSWVDALQTLRTTVRSCDLIPIAESGPSCTKTFARVLAFSNSET
jgi:hypothetical protein